jgi:hypothetical protein
VRVGERSDTDPEPAGERNERQADPLVLAAYIARWDAAVQRQAERVLHAPTTNDREIEYQLYVAALNQLGETAQWAARSSEHQHPQPFGPEPGFPLSWSREEVSVMGFSMDVEASAAKARKLADQIIRTLTRVKS